MCKYSRPASVVSYFNRPVSSRGIAQPPPQCYTLRMKRCPQLIPACLLFSLALAPLGEVYATGVRPSHDVRDKHTEVHARVTERIDQHTERRTEANNITTNLGLRKDHDSVGNIIQIVDTSLTHSAGTTTYAYDNLYRLTTATITDASSTPYTHTYAYTAIGNIASSSELGTYAYTGDTASDEGTKWANPHAVTGITPLTSTTTGPLTYDKNGNTTASNPHSDYLHVA